MFFAYIFLITGIFAQARENSVCSFLKGETESLNQIVSEVSNPKELCKIRYSLKGAPLDETLLDNQSLENLRYRGIKSLAIKMLIETNSEKEARIRKAKEQAKGALRISQWQTPSAADFYCSGAKGHTLFRTRATQAFLGQMQTHEKSAYLCQFDDGSVLDLVSMMKVDIEARSNTVSKLLMQYLAGSDRIPVIHTIEIKKTEDFDGDRQLEDPNSEKFLAKQGK